MSSSIGESDVVALCRDLVRAPGVSGHEEGAARVVRAWMERLGYDEIDVDACGNVVGLLYPRDHDRGTTLLFDGHIDTVAAVPADWRHDPFAAEMVDGRIYGRGALDMKGPLAAMICGAAAAARGGENGARLVVSASVDEEVLEGAALRYVVERMRPDAVVIGEPSGLQLQLGQRGRAEIVVEVHGRSAHASSPEVGINAARKMAHLIAAIDALPAPRDPLFGPGILELTELISYPQPGISVVPDLCRARYDRRLLPSETVDAALDPLRVLVAWLQTQDPTLDAAVTLADGDIVTYSGFTLGGPRYLPPWSLPADHPLARRALAALRGVGLTAPVGRYMFCTNGSYTAGVAGIPTIGFGPGDEKGAHVVDESIAVADLVSALTGYRALAAMDVEARDVTAR